MGQWCSIDTVHDLIFTFRLTLTEKWLGYVCTLKRLIFVLGIKFRDLAEMVDNYQQEHWREAEPIGAPTSIVRAVTWQSTPAELHWTTCLSLRSCNGNTARSCRATPVSPAQSTSSTNGCQDLHCRLSCLRLCKVLTPAPWKSYSLWPPHSGPCPILSWTSKWDFHHPRGTF